MVTENDILIAMRELYGRLGSQQAMADRAGITQSTINAYLNGKAKIENMPVGKFIRLFKEMKIEFFGGTTGNLVVDELRGQLLSIFDSLSDSDKVKMIAMVAANFGEKIREETKT